MLLIILIKYYFPVLCLFLYTKNIICQINVVIYSVCLLHKQKKAVAMALKEMFSRTRS